VPEQRLPCGRVIVACAQSFLKAPQRGGAGLGPVGGRRLVDEVGCVVVEPQHRAGRRGRAQLGGTVGHPPGPGQLAAGGGQVGGHPGDVGEHVVGPVGVAQRDHGPALTGQVEPQQVGARTVVVGQPVGESVQPAA
jgi:hypothetical protein